jgi:Xaa-Pro aminopeptidase
MVRDGQALCEFFARLEQALENRDDVPLMESMIDDWVTEARSRQPHFVGRSFATIAAFNANGAMPHYRATELNATQIVGDGLLLIDSGGQYLGGTTDITRMVPVGELSEQQRTDCTAVLQGMIALSRLRFPSGTPAPLIDAVARAPIWQRGLDYGHGTGHGVGYFLNVHEGPQVLSYRAPVSSDMALLAGMVTSNEPGVYRPGQWGVRIENLVCCQPLEQGAFGEFLAFETLTLCPIDSRCFAIDQLRLDERQWLNDYHQTVRQRLANGLSAAALQWLLARTEPLPL